ncbi:MAG: CDGSH iron-sulfur domain-containing protein, partial [Kangiellaceae bacterium]|nr:CDGSH iron-sulfur domain-containing protein [Kangiellaceae bacterium]
MPKAGRASVLPIPVEVKQGVKYYWCACSKTSTPPFCDGSHKGTNIEPVLYEPTRDKIVFFCHCKQSQQGVVCDGTHNHQHHQDRALTSSDSATMKTKQQKQQGHLAMNSSDPSQDLPGDSAENSPLESALWRLPPSVNHD